MQLDLPAYVAQSAAPDPGKVAVARSLAPEPFFWDLTLAGVDVQSWLTQVLTRGKPNAVHRAAASLAEAGAQVWTVNFDRLIEAALTSPVGISAWPDDPMPSARILKPHGSLGRPLIVASDQVLHGLAPAWEAKLRTDVADRTVIFVGYSGRDLDFRPIWDDVLAGAHRVIWFEVRPDATAAVVGEPEKRGLMPAADARGALEFPRPVPAPDGLAVATPPNPSWDFVYWCESKDLIELDPNGSRRLFAQRPRLSYPSLHADPFARASVLGLLGDYRDARKAYLKLIARREEPQRALARLVDSEVTHAGRTLGLALRPLMLVPDSVAGAWKPRLRRKLLTADHRCARHRRVLRATRNLKPCDSSTLLAIRASSLRVLGSLDEAEQTASEAFIRARAEGHPVRVAHAAFQQCMALVWADRVDEGQVALDTRLRPYASIAANRWVAWADFVEGELAVRKRDALGAEAAYESAAVRFGAELLVDGLVSVGLARLTVRRLASDDAAFTRQLKELHMLRHSRARGSLYYTRANRFTYDAITFERAEFARTHLRDLPAAGALYLRLAHSRYPLHQAFGYLGLALVNTELAGSDQQNVQRASQAAATIGQRLILQRTASLEAGAAGGAISEVFFC